MSEARKLTEAQARLAGEIASGAKLLRGAVTMQFYIEHADGSIRAIPTRMIDRMLSGGAVRSLNRRDRNNGLLFGLTDAGRAALARHRGEHDNG